MNARELALRCAACLKLVADNQDMIDESIRVELMQNVEYTLRMCGRVMEDAGDDEDRQLDADPPTYNPSDN